MITVEQLRAVLAYDPETGEFTRLSGRFEGKAGCVSKSNEYVEIHVSGKSYRGHRLAWLYMKGEWPREMVDHRNGLRADNRWGNLRVVTNGENQQNMRKARSHSSTGVLGVHINPRNTRRPYVTQIRADGKVIHIGSFSSMEEASAAYKSKKQEMHIGE